MGLANVSMSATMTYEDVPCADVGTVVGQLCAKNGDKFASKSLSSNNSRYSCIIPDKVCLASFLLTIKLDLSVWGLATPIVFQ